MKIYTKIMEIGSFIKDEKILREAERVEQIYPFRCTDYYLSLVEEFSSSDPIFRQIFPSFSELDEGEEDPFGEDGSTEHPCLIRRYKDRLLVLSTNQCFVHCRFCTRKRKWRDAPFVFEDFGALERYLKKHPEIQDVLISGGDPFWLPASWFDELLKVVGKIGSVRIVRIGTRSPVVAPEAVEDKLKVLSRHAPVWINTHFNHPKEITGESRKALLSLIKSGCPVNNQSVLLKGINDSYEVLKELLISLLSTGVRPYYLFSCDPVRGTAHFRVPVERGLSLIKRLRKELSGMAVPHFAVDTPHGKRILP